jgi:hypothetical protein
MSDQIVEGEFSEVPTTALVIPAPAAPPVRRQHVPRDLMPRDHDGQLWDRAMGESAPSFALFEAYRAMGPERSVLKTLNAYRKAKGKPPTRTISGYFAKISARWSWNKRAEAWDQHLVDGDRRAETEARKKDREQRLTAAKALRAKAAQGLKSLDAKDLSAGDIIQAIKIANAETRLEYEGDAKQRALSSGDGEQSPIKVLVGITLEDL